MSCCIGNIYGSHRDSTEKRKRKDRLQSTSRHDSIHKKLQQQNECYDKAQNTGHLWGVETRKGKNKPSRELEKR